MPAAWRPLPPHLPAVTRELVTRLREIKDSQGLSLSELAARTHYSRASWHRWLHAERLITPQALSSLASMAECDAAALQALLARATLAGGTAVDPQHRDAAAAPARPEVGDAGSAAGTAPAAAAEPQGPPSAGRVPDTAAPTSAADGEEAAEQEDPEGAPGSQDGRRRSRRWILAGAAAAALAAGAAAVSESAGAPHHRAGAATSSAAALGLDCHAAGCYGQDPQATCSKDARTIAEHVIEKAIIWMRYSPSCQAAWAKITDAVPGDQAVITSSLKQSGIALVHYGLDAYSPMVPAARGTVLQVCGTQTDKAAACTPLIPDAPDSPPMDLPSASASASRRS